MGNFFDCRVDNDFPKIEISKEINKEVDKNKKFKNEPKIPRNRTNFQERNKKKKNMNDVSNNDDDNMIIINTDEERSNHGKEYNLNIDKKKNSNNKDKKINNTIFINNSNVTISQRKGKKSKEDYKEIKPDFNYFNTNEDNIELDEILDNVFNNNRINTTNYKNNQNLLTESDIDYNYNKEFFEHLYSEQSVPKLDINKRNEDDEKIIKKLKQLKEKINNKNKSKVISNKKYKFKFEFNPKKAQRTISITNKQIKKNIPNYRKNRGFFNSVSFNKNYHFSKFKGFNYSSISNNTFGNSFNKSLYSSLMLESVKEHFYNMHSNNFSNDINDDLYIRNSRGTPSIYSMQKSYFNNSSINQTSSKGFNNFSNKNKKQKNLYKSTSKKPNKIKSKSTISKNKNSRLKEKFFKFDLKKEIEKDFEENNNILYHQYRDITEIILPNNFYNESIVNNKIYDISESNKNKIIINYNKLNNFKKSTILYDGILYKVNDRKNNGFKLSKRYFQITKNCFRYYNSFEQKREKPLVQFDIRHIKDLQIIENDFLCDYKIDNKDIEMVFCIYLNQNNDFFVFAVNNENLGKSVFDILNLLKNYYEDKK